NVIGRKAIVQRVTTARRPLGVLWWNFRRNVKRFIGVIFQNPAEQFFAVPCTIGPRSVEKVASKRNGAVKRCERLVVIGAGPSGHAPHSVDNFGDTEARAAERSEIHDEPPMRSPGATLCPRKKSAAFIAFLPGT